MIDLDENATPEKIIAEAMVNAGAPLMHSRVEEAVAGALRKAGMLTERLKQVCAWCPSVARGSARHNDGKLHPSCGQIDHGQSWVPDYPVERIGVIEAERDAALAAIERIREAVSGHPECDRYEESDVISCGWKSAYASVVAALDGAPEPEWEYARQNRYGNVCEPDDSREQAEYRASLSGGYDTVVRRRPAGLWLPVEGEKP